MFERIENSWRLVKASYEVLRADKELLVFPVVSLIASIIVIITFAVPMALAGLFDSVTQDGSGGLGAAHYIVAFLFYLVMYFVVIFFNSALVGAAMIRLRGGDPTLNDGLRIALDHIGSIFGYALISATVGVVLRALRERGGLVGQIVAALGGLAWGVMTYLVVPVLVVENIGPVEAIKRSGSLLKRTWGEQIVGSFSIGAFFGLITLAAVLAVGIPLGALAAALNSPLLILLVVGLVILIIAALSLLSSALSGIYTAALYRYATEDVVVDQFNPELIQGAFHRK